MLYLNIMPETGWDDTEKDMDKSYTDMDLISRHLLSFKLSLH